VGDALVVNTMYKDVSVSISSGVPGQTFWFVFIKEPKPTTTPHCPRYTDADAEAAVAKYGHLLMGPGFTVKDTWDWRTKGVLVPMEEGVVPVSWNNGGRVVLLGDSITKVSGGQSPLSVCYLRELNLANDTSRPPPMSDSAAIPTSKQSATWPTRLSRSSRATPHLLQPS